MYLKTEDLFLSAVCWIVNLVPLWNYSDVALGTPTGRLCGKATHRRATSTKRCIDVRLRLWHDSDPITSKCIRAIKHCVDRAPKALY